MTIGELVAESGLCASPIRYWERIGVLPKPETASSERRYSAGAVQRLDGICHLLKGCGPGVEPRRRWRELAWRKQQEIDEQIARFEAMRRVVDRVLQCLRLDLSECERIDASVMESAQ